jgi:hypothetical protein
MTYDLNVMIHFRSLADASGFDFFPLFVRANGSAQLQKALAAFQGAEPVIAPRNQLETAPIATAVPRISRLSKRG